MTHLGVLSGGAPTAISFGNFGFPPATTPILYWSDSALASGECPISSKAALASCPGKKKNRLVMPHLNQGCKSYRLVLVKLLRRQDAVFITENTTKLDLTFLAPCASSPPLGKKSHHRRNRVPQATKTTCCCVS